MIELTNYVSKILHNDTDNSYYILTYTDFDELFGTEYIINYINKLTSNNSILTRLIVEIDNSFFLDNVKLFNMDDYYKIVHTNVENFDDYVNSMLNDEITTTLKWRMLWCLDKESNKTRFYMKIHHAYVDGYQLIKLLMTPFNTDDRDIIPQFKRKTDLFETIYYYIIGTIVLICLNVRFLLNICSNLTTNVDKKTLSDTDFIICKELNFQEMKTFTRKNNITINDFCYSLMIKTDNLYTNKERLLSTSSPINTSRSSQPNNVCPIFNIISNAYDNNTLLKRIHDTFNAYKYSLFIPMFSYFINNITPFIHIGVLSNGYNIITENTDYIYSNMIGPSLDDTSVKVSNIHFLTTSKHKEIIFNIISCNNKKINIICSFKKGVITDKVRFEKCIYDAYESLITTY
jgi:hypothetical protein